MIFVLINRISVARAVLLRALSNILVFLLKHCEDFWTKWWELRRSMFSKRQVDWKEIDFPCFCNFTNLAFGLHLKANLSQTPNNMSLRCAAALLGPNLYHANRTSVASNLYNSSRASVGSNIYNANRASVGSNLYNINVPNEVGTVRRKSLKKKSLVLRGTAEPVEPSCNTSDI